MNYGQRKLREIIEKIALEMRDPVDNYVYQDKVIKEVESLILRGEVEEAITNQIALLVARSQVKGFFDSRKPKFTAQGSLYFPGFWLPLGKGKRVQMRDASDYDLIEYGEGVHTNRRRVDIADDRTREYVSERVRHMKLHAGHPLHWVEVNIFDYDESSPVDPEDYLEGDDE